jgi:hypothetical protein
MCYSSLTTSQPVILASNCIIVLVTAPERAQQLMNSLFTTPTTPCEFRLPILIPINKTNRATYCTFSDWGRPYCATTHQHLEDCIHRLEVVPTEWWKPPFIPPTQPYDSMDTFLSLEGLEKPKGFLLFKKN